MRRAPAVNVTASNAGVWRWFQVLLLAASAGAGAAWAALHLGLTPLFALGWAGGSTAVMAVLAWHCLRSQPVHLRWTGASWEMSTGSGGGFIDLRSAEVAVDAGALLVLRLRPASGSAAAWIAVTRTEAGPDFRALCVALYAASLVHERPTLAADGPRAR
jgi:hypothetical protein